MPESPEVQGLSFPAHVLDLVPGRQYPLSAHYNGLLYPGEAILAEGWEPQWGLPLEGERLFRVVFLSTHQPVSPEELQDARIAVCVPSRSGERREQERRREYRVLREVRSRYSVPGPDPALLEQERGAYASGTIVTRTGVETQPRALFEAPLPADWVSAVAVSLLAWTYPQLPVSSADFPGPFTAREARLLFQGLIQEETTPEVVAAVEVFGPGLGLTTGQAAGVFAPGDSIMFQILRHELAEHGGALPCSQLYGRMVHVHGLLHPLVTLCVVAFLRYGQPPVELHLAAEHSLQTVSGERYSGRVVLAETVADLDFPSSLDSVATSLRYTTPVSWNTLAFYFSPLDPSIQPVEEPESQEEIPRLLAALATLQREVRETLAALQRIAQNLGGEIPQQTVNLLGRLRRLTEARAAEPALRAGQRLFGSPAGLAQAMKEYQPLHLLATMEETLVHIHAYLKEAHVPDDLGDLSLKRQQLVAVLRPRELVTSTPSQTALEMLITGFLEAYRAAYIHHHERYHQEVASLSARVEEARTEAQGLERLNSIRELGEPVEEGATRELRRLSTKLTACQTPPREIPLGRHPICQECRLLLGQRSPSEKVEAVFRRLRMGLREQNTRISTQVVHRILEGTRDERIDQFIRVVQASDLTGLANVLDDRLVSFLRVLLAQS